MTVGCTDFFTSFVSVSCQVKWFVTLVVTGMVLLVRSLFQA